MRSAQPIITLSYQCSVYWWFYAVGS